MTLIRIYDASNNVMTLSSYFKESNNPFKEGHIEMAKTQVADN